MGNKEIIQDIVNQFAMASAVLQEFKDTLASIHAMDRFEELSEELIILLERNWREKDLESFSAFLKRQITAIRIEEKTKRYIHAYALCKWIDHKVIYGQEETQKHISLFDLLPFEGTKPVEIGPLNSNHSETGVQIIPKFPVCRLYDRDIEKERDSPNPFANRGAFVGLNGELKNVSVIEWRQAIRIRNIVLPPKYSSKSNGNLTIAFCPMTDQSDALNIRETELWKDDIKYSAIELDGVLDPECLLARMRADWRTACGAEGNADIVFWPEALGSHKTEHTINGERYNKEIYDLSKEFLMNGIFPPLITILPSYSAGRKNRATIIYRDGQILGYQQKYVPFIDVKHHRIEALEECELHEYIVLHIPGVHRIVVLICAEFLQMCVESDCQLFDEVGATLVLVPSYTPGERDFINALPSLKCYGTTVIWGNCCGATKGKTYIGGCSVAGTEAIHRFSQTCKCNHSCEGRKACAFIISLPLKFEITKDEAADIQEICHIG